MKRITEKMQLVEIRHIMFCLGTILCGSACGDAREQLTCENIDPASQASFSKLFIDLQDSCAGCHNGFERIYGYNFQTRDAAYENARYRAESIYAQIASGNMPQEDDPWSAEQLKKFRTWYCHGGFYK